MKQEILESIAIGITGQVQGFRYKGESLENAAARCVLEAEMKGNAGEARIHLAIKEEAEPEVGQSRLAATLAKAIYNHSGEVSFTSRETGQTIKGAIAEQVAYLIQAGLAMTIDRELAEIRAAFVDLQPCPIVTHHPEGPCASCAGYALRDVLLMRGM